MISIFLKRLLVAKELLIQEYKSSSPSGIDKKLSKINHLFLAINDLIYPGYDKEAFKQIIRFE
jgi:hypothetical protein